MAEDDMENNNMDQDEFHEAPPPTSNDVAALQEVTTSVSSVSSAVTLETLSEDVASSASPPGGQMEHEATVNLASNSANVHHLLTCPTSPRSVTTASMSASGKPWFFYWITDLIFPDLKILLADCLMFQNSLGKTRAKIVTSL